MTHVRNLQNPWRLPIIKGGGGKAAWISKPFVLKSTCLLIPFSHVLTELPSFIALTSGSFFLESCTPGLLCCRLFYPCLPSPKVGHFMGPQRYLFLEHSLYQLIRGCCSSGFHFLKATESSAGGDRLLVSVRCRRVWLWPRAWESVLSVTWKTDTSSASRNGCSPL